MFTALYELASASAHTLLKLASSVRALLKPYGDTLNRLGKVAYQAGTNLGFCTCSMKQMGIILLSQDGMLFYRRVTLSINFDETYLCIN